MPSRSLATVNPLWSKKRLAGKREVRSMGRYPFISCVNKYIRMVGSSFSPATVVELGRRFRHMNTDLRLLENKGLISSTNPTKMTPEDILAYVGYLKSKGMRERYLP